MLAVELNQKPSRLLRSTGIQGPARMELQHRSLNSERRAHLRNKIQSIVVVYCEGVETMKQRDIAREIAHSRFVTSPWAGLDMLW